MNGATKILLTAGTAIGLGLAAAAVSAQGYGPGWGGWHMGGYGPGYGMMGGYGPGNGRGPGMMGGYGPGYGMGPGHGRGPQAMFGNVADNLAALKEQLGITTKQDDAWQAFAKSAKQQSESRQAWFAKMQAARSAGSAPEFMAQQAEFMKQREAETAAGAAALKDLYAALTPEQKQLADQSFGGYGPAYCEQAFGCPGGRFR